MRPSRRRGRIGGLRGQFLLGLIALLILALALVALATLQLHKRHLQQQVAAEAARHAGWLAQIESPDEGARAAAALQSHPEILAVGATADADGDELPRRGASVLIDFEGIPAVRTRSADGEDVYVIVSLVDAQNAIDSGRHALILYLGLTLIFITLLGYAFFSLVFLRPLRALSVAAGRAAEGDLASPVTVLPRNELGEVGRKFNSMLDRLDRQRTELRQKLQALEEANGELIRTQESLIRSEKLAGVGQLAAGVAHEVGNPLAAVMGYTDLLRDRNLDEAMADDLACRSLTQLKRIRQIIRQLLDYSRVESETEPTPTDVGRAIDEAVHLVRATAPAQGVDINLSVGELPPASAISGELGQVLVNLLLNALQAMEGRDSEPATIEVAASADEEHLQIDIIDSGPGIEEEIAERIFDPFFTTGGPGQGTGLGLAIAHRLITRVDGDLSLVPSESGAHFRILLRRT